MVVATGSRKIIEEVAIRTERTVSVTVRDAAAGSLSTKSTKSSGHALIAITVGGAFFTMLLV
jgi:hypothetical protein